MASRLLDWPSDWDLRGYSSGSGIALGADRCARHTAIRPAPLPSAPGRTAASASWETILSTTDPAKVTVPEPARDQPRPPLRPVLHLPRSPGSVPLVRLNRSKSRASTSSTTVVFSA